MSTEDLIAILGDECEFLAGLRYQREAGANVDSLVQGSVARLIMRAGQVRGAVGTAAAGDVSLLDRAGPLTALYEALGKLKSVRGKNGKPVSLGGAGFVDPRLAKMADKLRADINTAHLEALELVQAMSVGFPAPPPVSTTTPATAPATGATKPVRDRTSTIRPPAPIPAGDDGLPDSALKVLAAAAAFYPGHQSQQAIATAADYSHKSSSFKRDWSLLRRAGYLQEMGAGRWRATQGGCMRLGKAWQPIPKSLAARVAFWKERVARNEARILDAVVASDVSGFTMGALADAVSLSATSSAFKAHVSNLKANDLIAKRGDRLVMSDSLRNGVAHV